MNRHLDSFSRQPWSFLLRFSTTQQQHWSLIFVVGMMSIVTILHYLTNVNLLPYHSIYRSLYYLPVGVAAVVWGARAGVTVASITAILYLPHSFFLQLAIPNKALDSGLEMITLAVVAALIGTLADAERHHRHQADILRIYINDVLASLPVGVATVEGTTFKRQNPAADTLLPTALDISDLPGTLGYHELTLDERPLAIYRSPLHGTDGHSIGHVVVIEDVSEQRRLAEQVRRAERMAALGQLAGGLAHEVRNPLGIVRATTQLLQTKLRDRPDLHDYTRIVTAESDRIDRLIGDLLQYASPRPLERRPFDIANLLSDLTTACIPLAQQHAVHLRLTLDEPAIINADWDYLWQALLNILLNAMQASAPGQYIEVGTASNEDIAIHIRDHGAGIAPHIREHLFDPFFTTRDDGTGMGLAVVARIVAEHQGTIDISSPAQGGTWVTLHLPKSQEVNDDAAHSCC